MCGYCLYGQKSEYDACNQIELQRIKGKKPLKTSEVGVALNARGHRRRNLMQTDRLHHAEGIDHKSQQFYAGEVHHTAKMLLHNRDDLVNFAIVPGSGSNFHGKSSRTFL